MEGDEADEVRAHLTECAACRAVERDLVRLNQLLADSERLAPADPTVATLAQALQAEYAAASDLRERRPVGEPETVPVSPEEHAAAPPKGRRVKMDEAKVVEEEFSEEEYEAAERRRRFTFWERLGLIQYLLQRRGIVFEDLKRGRDLGPYALDMFIVTFLLTAVYGLVVGVCVGLGSWQVLYNPIKMPFILVLTLALTVFTLYVFSSYFGARLSFLQTLALSMTATTVISIILAAFAPITFVFMFTAPESYNFHVLVNVAVFSIAGFFGVSFLLAAMRHVHRDNPQLATFLNVVKGWIVLYGIVGAQMSWLLRPFFHATNVFLRPRGGNIFEAIFKHLMALLGGSGL
jgi:hypothetical protein